MQIELKRIQREVGITFVYVTHDQSEALTMSDRIAVMNDGLIEQLGSPREIYERPATRFVAGFIGTSNLLERHRRPASAAAWPCIELGPGERVRRAGAGRVRPATTIEVTVRPEKIDVSHRPSRTGDGSVVRGTVTEVVYLGTSPTTP